MARWIFGLGNAFETLTKPELSDALAAQYDLETRTLLRGVKPFDLFLNLNQINALVPAGGTANVITLSGGMSQSPPSGFVWAVMNVGYEASGSTNLRIYKGAWPGASSTLSGQGRLVAANTGTPQAGNLQFSKGQFMLKSGDAPSFLTVTPAMTLLSLFISGIECPAERVGELLL
jgi:hypothetical protein